MNPSGAINYARYVIDQDINATLNIAVQPRFQRQLVGTANVVANQSGVWGTNTYFALANTLGFLHTGSYIKVNTELRVVNSVINNTYLTVSENFNYNANDVIISTMIDYDSLLNEIYEEVRIEGTPPIYITTEGVEE